MRSNIKIGRISGIEIGLNYSWLFIAALITISLAGHFHDVNPTWNPGVIWAAAILTSVLFFVTLLLHELAHSLVGQALGLKVKAITLFALGGVSQIEDDASDAKTEFWVAIAGPLASLIIGFGCLGLAVLLGWRRSNEPQTLATAVLVWLGYINIALAVFNMIPGFPLDGGRVLRAILWAVTKNARRSTQIAARIGQVVAVLFMLDGIWQALEGGSLSALWMVFIGWFLLDAARASYAQADVTAVLDGLTVSRLMARDCVTVDRRLSLQAFIDMYLFRNSQRCFAVEDHGELVGIITPRDVRAVRRDLWDKTSVGDTMLPIAEAHTVAPDTPALEALKLMARYDVNQLPVVVNGKLLGMVARGQMMQFLQSRFESQASGTRHPILDRGNAWREVPSATH